MTRDLTRRAARVLSIEAEGLLALREKLDHQFTRAVEMLLRAPGKVIVTGMGKSGLIGRKVAATLASTGTPAFFLCKVILPERCSDGWQKETSSTAPCFSWYPMLPGI